MPDLSTIATALGSIRAATEIAKLLRESDLSMERAELKLKLAELVSALADAKMQLAEVQDVLLEKDKMIAELQEAFGSKDSLVRRYDAYYLVDKDGSPTGVPFCLRCWEQDHKRRQLVHDSSSRLVRVCTDCGQKYQGHLAGEIPPPR